MARNYLTRSRHGTVYYFRRRVPDDLRTLLGRPYLVKSLCTGQRREAVILARAYATRTDSLFKYLKNMPEHDKNIQVDLIFKLDLNDLGGLKAVYIEADTPEEHLQANVMLSNVLQNLQPPVSQVVVGMQFPDALAEYLADAQIKPNTRKTYKGRLEQAQAYFGADKDIRHIEQAELSGYARKLVKEMPDPTTAGHHITTLGTFLNWYRTREGWGNPLTTKTLIPKKDTPVTEERHGFTVEQLGFVIKNARRYQIKQPCKYWAIVATAFTGCRIEELAQINLHTDLKQNTASGVWYFDLNGKADQDGMLRKSMKNKASWRCVPIHSALVSHGLIDYLKGQVKAGYSRPFESGWKPRVFEDGKAFKWSHYITNWGGRELGKLIADGELKDPERMLTCFHSMRHTFSQCLGRAKVTAEMAEALLGHSYADSERERYHKLKSDPEQLSREGIEPGLLELAALLSRL